MRLPLRSMRLLWLATAAAALFAGGASAGEFKRGVNINQWLDTYATGGVSAQELKALRQAGFDHVRLPLDPIVMGWAPEAGPRLSHMDQLHQAIAMILAADLDVIVDMHPDGEVQQRVESGEAADALVQLWTWLATELRQTPPDSVALELLNEPQYQGFGGAHRWDGYQRRLLATVRAVLPTHPVVVSGRQTGTLDGLVELETYDDPNLIYSFHFYEPAIFTHQGAVWMRNVPWTTAGHWHDVRYPALDRWKAQSWMEGASTLSDTTRIYKERDDYFDVRWSVAQVTERWRPLVAWAARNPSARIRLGEFGVIRAGVNAASRYRWLGDVRRQAESHGWGWTMWNYASDFGITTKSNVQGLPRGTLEPAALAALGVGTPTATSTPAVSIVPTAPAGAGGAVATPVVGGPP